MPADARLYMPPDQDAKTTVERAKALWRNHQFRKLLRYSAVSLVFVPLGQVFVQVFYWLFAMREMWAVIATSVILTPPNYYANKRFVWRHKAKDNMHTEILVFWVAAILGTASAAALVTVAAHLVPQAEYGAKMHALALFVAQLVGFGIVWVARFVFLDKLLFKAANDHVDDGIVLSTDPSSDSTGFPG